jgi:hypothetical protein
MDSTKSNLPDREFTLHEQSRLARFTRILTVMTMARKYEAMLKVNLIDDPFNMNQVQKGMLDKVVGIEVEAFLQRHICVPKGKSGSKPCRATWTKNISVGVDDAWVGFENGLITWGEFLNQYIFDFNERFSGFLKYWDMSAARNLFA